MPDRSVRREKAAAWWLPGQGPGRDRDPRDRPGPGGPPGTSAPWGWGWGGHTARRTCSAPLSPVLFRASGAAAAQQAVGRPALRRGRWPCSCLTGTALHTRLQALRPRRHQERMPVQAGVCPAVGVMPRDLGSAPARWRAPGFRRASPGAPANPVDPRCPPVPQPKGAPTQAAFARQ